MLDPLSGLVIALLGLISWGWLLLTAFVVVVGIYVGLVAPLLAYLRRVWVALLGDRRES